MSLPITDNFIFGTEFQTDGNSFFAGTSDCSCYFYLSEMLSVWHKTVLNYNVKSISQWKREIATASTMQASIKVTP